MENTTVTLTDAQFEQLTKILARALKKWMPRDVYTYEQAAHRLGISKNRVRRDYILTGRLDIVMIDGQMKIPNYAIENYLKSNTKYYAEVIKKSR
ncbi:MAG: helix-turn-helix domain-containing protein [Bacteroidetes bacterium]|nr:helix-turn-helix domain-containing protein [Bacteroidota bacterium]